MYVFPKKKVTYRGGQVGDQAWKFSRHWVKAGRIGNPTGRNVKPSVSTVPIAKYCLWQWQFQPGGGLPYETDGDARRLA